MLFQRFLATVRAIITEVFLCQTAQQYVNNRICIVKILVYTRSESLQNFTATVQYFKNVEKKIKSNSLYFSNFRVVRPKLK